MNENAPIMKFIDQQQTLNKHPKKKKKVYAQQFVELNLGKV